MSKGPMPLDVFQNWALFHPKYGYYITQPAIGAEGDFITAPEISQMFGELVGVWIIDLWQQFGEEPSSVQLIECGPGRGTMIQDILRVIQSLLPDLLPKLDVISLEVNPFLKRHQEEKWRAFSSVRSFSWCEDIEVAVQGSNSPCFVLANEFFDVLPIKQYEKKTGNWYERCVSWCCKTQALKWDFVPSNFEKEGYQEGDCVEYSPWRENFFQIVIESLKERQGAFWVCDYGYTRSAAGNSLQALFQKSPSRILENVGCSDLSSHVDFSSFIHYAHDQELSVHGPVPMMVFLKNLGIKERLETLRRDKNISQRALLQAQYERMISPLQMGTLFQVMAVCYPKTLVPSGLQS